MKTAEDLHAYAIRVQGESLTDWSGAVPDNIDVLLQKPSKDTATLLFQIVKTQVEMLCQKGDTTGAMEALEAYKKQSFTYGAPLNCFKRDQQNGKFPYQGGHCFYGAFRDSAGDLFDIFYKKKGDLQDGKASDRHMRKSVRVMPNHVFLYRGKEIIRAFDVEEAQQPTEGVGGFTRYEVIRHPFNFEFVLQILPRGPFAAFLKDSKKVREALYASTLNGQGARRGAGYGGWKITKAEIETFRLDEA